MDYLKPEYLEPKVVILPFFPEQAVLQASGEPMGEKEEEW